jgi:serine/threonine-protein kinase
MYQIVNFAPPVPSAVNREVPELLDYIVAKMLAKALEERYQGALDVAVDLRECERQLTAPASVTLPPRPAGALASGAQPELLATDVKKVVLAQTLNRTRQVDNAPETVAAPPARGLAHSFDSLEATQRLAAITGATTETIPELKLDQQTATQVLESMPRPPRARWRRRDWLLVGGAGIAGLLLAGAIVRRRSRD